MPEYLIIVHNYFLIENANLKSSGRIKNWRRKRERERENRWQSVIIYKECVRGRLIAINLFIFEKGK